MRRIRLGVNIDHVATLRQARLGRWPDPVAAAQVCEHSGAASIVCHLREDRRHIQDADVRRLCATVRTLNLEMSLAQDIVRIALAHRPAQVTLVPERRRELTTEGGLDVVRLRRRLRPVVRRFQRAGIAVSLFIDPLADQLAAARDTGATIVELHTGRYAAAPRAAAPRQLQQLRQAARQGRRLGLDIAAGHGLDYDNVSAIAMISEVAEVNIGFSIMARALDVGLASAVAQMLDRLSARRRATARA